LKRKRERFKRTNISDIFLRKKTLFQKEQMGSVDTVTMKESKEKLLDIHNEELYRLQECCVCLSQPPNCVSMPCRHMCLCLECAMIFLQSCVTYNQCPLCSQKCTVWDMDHGKELDPLVLFPSRQKWQSFKKELFYFLVGVLIGLFMVCLIHFSFGPPVFHRKNNNHNNDYDNNTNNTHQDFVKKQTLSEKQFEWAKTTTTTATATNWVEKQQQKQHVHTHHSNTNNSNINTFVKTESTETRNFLRLVKYKREREKTASLKKIKL